MIGFALTEEKVERTPHSSVAPVVTRKDALGVARSRSNDEARIFSLVNLRNTPVLVGNVCEMSLLFVGLLKVLATREVRLSYLCHGGHFAS